MTRTLATLTAVCAAALAGAGPAAADSIVYVKDHNVWLANADGSGRYQVTTDGAPGWGYGSPSQADDGTIVARRGTDIVRMRQNGEVLSSFDPPDTTDSAGQHIGGSRRRWRSRRTAPRSRTPTTRPTARLASRAGCAT